MSENHRTNTHDPSNREGLGPRRRRRVPNEQPVARGRPVLAANPPQAAVIREAALFDENDHDEVDVENDALSDLQNDTIDSGSDGSEGEEEAEENGWRWANIVAENQQIFQNQRQLQHPGEGIFAADNQIIPRFLGEDDQGPSYQHIRRTFSRNSVENGGSEVAFRYRPEVLSALDFFTYFFGCSYENISYSNQRFWTNVLNK